MCGVGEIVEVGRSCGGSLKAVRGGECVCGGGVRQQLLPEWRRRGDGVR